MGICQCTFHPIESYGLWKSPSTNWKKNKQQQQHQWKQNERGGKKKREKLCACVWPVMRKTYNWQSMWMKFRGKKWERKKAYRNEHSIWVLGYLKELYRLNCPLQMHAHTHMDNKRRTTTITSAWNVIESYSHLHHKRLNKNFHHTEQVSIRWYFWLGTLTRDDVNMRRDG